MAIKYLKKAPKTASTDDAKTREIVQTLLKDLETSKETGCKELTKKFDKYDGEIVVSQYSIGQMDLHIIMKVMIFSILKFLKNLNHI